ncbi:MAG: tRNA pseudouridine(38-40) synthase TruA [bacterium]|nr:tRNA pseudouridine(38-40) synthase TruA [bacterium]
MSEIWQPDGIKRRYKLVISYIGNDFSGSQIQAVSETTNGLEPRTVQSELEKVFCTLTNRKIKTIFSGRTDAGVHSKGQVVHFDILGELDVRRFENALNGNLPNDISVSKLELTDKTFHAQKSALARFYRYKITNRPQRNVWDGHSLLVRKPLDVERMNKCLEFLIGEHDFSAFKSSQTNNPAKICNMYKAHCVASNDFIYFDFVADRFLYNMIRTIIGTILWIENNNFDPTKMLEILNSKDRTKAGATISPDGLVLMKVIYTNNDKLEAINENIFS